MTSEGKVALVTGAAVGVGRMLSLRLAKSGTKVALVDRNKRGMKETLDQIVSAGGAAEFFLTDLLNDADLVNTVKDIQEGWGRIDILANIAGLWHDEGKRILGDEFHETPVDRIKTMIGVNLMAPVLLTRACLPAMVKRRSGKILNLSGSFPEHGYGMVPYYVGKIGVENLTRSIAVEVRKYGIQVNCLCPGDMDTKWFREMYPEFLKYAISADDVIELAMFLLENPAAEQITGQVIGIGDQWSQWDMGQNDPDSTNQYPGVNSVP